MRWKPERELEGATVYIIGGGPSLRGFNWERLAKERTVGCNAAYTHGAALCNYCLFSDELFWKHNSEGLEQYAQLGGKPVTHCEYVPADRPWLASMARNLTTMTADGYSLYQGYGGNSGSAAIHLALLLGAKRVLLLGFDGKLGADGKSNWHERTLERPNAAVYTKFEEAFDYIAANFKRVFPGTEVLNCNPDSAYRQFPFHQLEVHA